MSTIAEAIATTAAAGSSSANMIATKTDFKTHQEDEGVKKSKILFIPQGFSGRLTLNSAFYGIEGLYLDDYRACNILVCISNDRSKGIACHIDEYVCRYAFEKIKTEIEWVGEEQELFIISRPSSGLRLKKSLLAQITFGLQIPIHVLGREVREDEYGVLFSLNQDMSSPPVQFFLKSKAPASLLHHPNEQRFLTIQKIEQIIGKVHNIRYETEELYKSKHKAPRVKQFSIFDGNAFESLEAETALQILSENTQKEINSFNKTDNYLQICIKARAIIENIQTYINKSDVSSDDNTDTADEIASAAAFDLETYINGFKDFETIFYRNLQDFLGDKRIPPKTTTDKKVAGEIKHLIISKAPLAEFIIKIEPYKNKATNTDTDYKKLLLEEFVLQKEHYELREKFQLLAEQNKKNLGQATQFNKEAVNLFINNHFSEAATLFEKAILLSTFCLTKADKELANLYLNYGKTLLKLKNYKIARQLIEYSFLLKHGNQKTKISQDEIKEIQELIKECKKEKSQSQKENKEKDKNKDINTKTKKHKLIGYNTATTGFVYYELKKQNNYPGPVIISLQGLQISTKERELLAHPNVGGLVLFRENWDKNSATPKQALKTLIKEIRAINPHIIIMVDHEGGKVWRFEKDFTKLPSAREFGKKYMENREAGLKFAFEQGYIMASELLECGIDLSLAPVLDLDGESNVIGKLDRAYHSDPKIVSEIAEEFIKGMNSAGMPATAKHFPGHGTCKADSHKDKPVDNRSLELLQADLLPFKTMVSKQRLGAVMPAHVTYPAVDADNPAGFSEKWIQGMLRAWGFNGVVMSDCLSMEGANLGGSLERLLAAQTAGCDFLMITHQKGPALDTLLKALDQIKDRQASAKRRQVLSNSVVNTKQATEFSKLTAEITGLAKPTLASKNVDSVKPIQLVMGYLYQSKNVLIQKPLEESIEAAVKVIGAKYASSLF